MAFQYVIDNLVGELVKVAHSEAEGIVETIKESEEWKFEAVMCLTLEKDEIVDMVIDALSDTIKNHKINQQFWVAISKRNWKLLKPIRKKYRESCDAIMERDEIMVGKGYLPEGKYVDTADNFKENLGYMDAVISRCEGSFRLVL